MDAFSRTGGSTADPLRRSGRVLLFLALLAYSLAFQGSRGLFAPDEGRYAGVALGMLRDKDWIHPRLHPEQPHYTKPPLTYWAIASSIALLGRNDWAARLPNAVAFAATVLLVLGLGRRLSPARAWGPALLYATCAGPYLAANIVTTDTILTFFETLAGYAFLVAWQEPARRGRFVLLLWTALGLAFLTKGPPGLLPIPAMAAFITLRRGWRAIGEFVRPGGLVLFALVGLSWYAKVALDSPGLSNRLLAHELLGRVATAEHHRNAQWYKGLLVYGTTFLLGALPWTVPCLIRAGASLRSIISVVRTRSFWAREENLFPILWFVIPLAVFLAARSRLSLYVVPLFVPLALLASRLLSGHGRPARSLLAGLALWALFLAGVRGAAARVPFPDKDDRALATEVEKLAGRPREVLFVGTTTRYGVGFYLDVEVERLGIGEESGPAKGIKTLEAAWRERSEAREDARTYLVSPVAARAFERAATAAGRKLDRKGTTGGLAVYLTALR